MGEAKTCWTAAATRVPAFGPEDEERALGFLLDPCEHIEQIAAVGRAGASKAIRPFIVILKEGL